jgi:RNA polymerase sigma factor (sigma-70 family)
MTMKRVELQTGEDTEGDDPIGPNGRASGPGPVTVRTSGVYARSERRPRDEAPAVAPANQGRCRSVEEIHERYKHRVWSWIRRPGIAESDALDIFQSVFEAMNVWSRDHDIPEDPAPLLFKMVDNRVQQHRQVRQRAAKRIDGEADADMVPASKPDPEQLFERAESLHDAEQKVETILARMPTDAANLITMSDLYELSPDQIAWALDRPAGTVRVQLHRARAMFRNLAVRLYGITKGGSL